MSTSTRERLLDEAMRLFGERGYDATSVAEIERSAGLTPGAGGEGGERRRAPQPSLGDRQDALLTIH